MINAGRNIPSGQNDLPISRQATTILSQVNKLVGDIHEALLKAFQLHEAKMIYEGIFEQVGVFFKTETTREQMDKSIYRDHTVGLSIDSIQRCFDNMKLSLTYGQFDVIDVTKDVNSVYDNLSDRKKELLVHIIYIFRHLVYYKYLMTNLQPQEFAILEQEIETIHFDNVLNRFKPSVYVKPVSLNVSCQDLNKDQCSELICLEYEKKIKLVLMVLNEDASLYYKLDNEIKQEKKVVSEKIRNFKFDLEQHNQAREFISAHNELKKRISEIRVQIRLEMETLKKSKGNARSSFLEQRIPSQIKSFHESLTAIANEEKELLTAYSVNAGSLRSGKRQLISAILSSKEKLQEKLADIPPFSDIPRPPEFGDILKKRRHIAYLELEQELKALERQKTDIQNERKKILDTSARINEIFEKSKEMAGHAVKFRDSQLNILEKVQKKIEILIKNFIQSCENQTTVTKELYFDGFMPVLGETQAYKTWKAVAVLAADNLPLIYQQCSGIVSVFHQSENNAAQQNEELAITADISSRKQEIESSLEKRLGYWNKEFNSANQNILDHQQAMTKIRNKLHGELESMYENACVEQENVSLSIPSSQQLTGKINNIETEFLAQKSVNEIFTENSALREKQLALNEIQELEHCLNIRQADLLMKRIDGFANKGDKKNPDKLPSDNDPSSAGEPDRNNKPGFWSRHKGKIIGGIAGLVTGAIGGVVAGATAGAFLAPATWGLSIPVCAVICGVIGGVAGAIAGAIGGVIAGSVVDCCLKPDIASEEEIFPESEPSQRQEPRTLPQNIIQNVSVLSGRHSGSYSPRLFPPFDHQVNESIRGEELNRSFTPK